MRILIVDDDLTWITPLSRLMRNEHTLLASNKGADALEMFKTGQFDLVITDVVMPGMSGLDVLKAIRGMDASVPVIVVSGYQHEWFERSALELGAYAFFSKPIDVGVFIDTLGLIASKQSRVS